jgi:hypothetical protein
VRWGTLQRQAESFEDTFEVFKHLVIPKAEHPIAGGFDHG